MVRKRDLDWPLGEDWFPDCGVGLVPVWDSPQQTHIQGGRLNAESVNRRGTH